MIRSRKKLSVLIATCLSAQVAIAQESPSSSPATLDTVQVTGSYVARSADVTAYLPVTAVDREEIDNAGTLFLTDVLRQEPALGTNSRSAGNIYNGAGATGLSMRSLGDARTMVLLNGQRFPGFSDTLGNTTLDISVIPSIMLERVDILRDGASTTYGADAVAGVVNFILRDKFDGAQVDLYAGISGEGDVFGRKVSAIYGVSNDRGNLVVAGQWHKTDPMTRASRKWAHNRVTNISSGVRGVDTTPGGHVLGPDRRTVVACYPNAGGASTFPDCPRYDNLEDDLTFGSALKSFAFSGNYHLTDNVKVYSSLVHSTRESDGDRGANNVNTSGLTGVYNDGFAIPASSPNNPYGQDVYLRWSPRNYAPRRLQGENDFTWFNVGFSGVFRDYYHWDVRHAHGETKAKPTYANGIVNSISLYNLLNPSACAGDPVCSGIGAIGNIDDFLSQRTRLTDDQVNYLFGDSTADVNFVSQQTLAVVSGPLASLAAGDLALAVGLEHREESVRITPDALSQAGVSIGTFLFPTRGSFNTNEVFAELDIPVLDGKPLAHRLDFNLQARYSDFSNFGGADTYKASFNYAPIESLRFRGSYGTSFRAPSLIELYRGGVGALANLQDPCDSAGLRASDPTVAANCAALGVPADYTQISFGVPQRSGGNPGLQPEEGKSFTLGMVISPTALPGLTATLDYYRIQVENAIAGGATLQADVNGCYMSPTFLSDAANPTHPCSSFDIRQGDGSFGRINVRSKNIQSMSTSGMDFNVAYQFDDLTWLPGSLRLDTRVSWLRSYVLDGREWVHSYISGVEGTSTYPRWRGTGGLTYRQGRFTGSWTANWVKDMIDSAYGTTIPVNNPLNYSGTGTYFSHDVLFNYRFDDLSVGFGVNNVFDKTPPFANASRMTLSAFDVIGRYFFGTVSWKF